jgi:hypothetical protein
MHRPTVAQAPSTLCRADLSMLLFPIMAHPSTPAGAPPPACHYLARWINANTQAHKLVPLPHVTACCHGPGPSTPTGVQESPPPPRESARVTPCNPPPSLCKATSLVQQTLPYPSAMV